jgi:dolichol-phosphate mannosyltransferase
MTTPTVSVIIPTFQERDNLPLLIPRIDASLRSAYLQGEILVVDDDSQDGTDEACTALARQYPVRLAIRKNQRGLASAVMHGFAMARGDVLVVMDADLSHPPEKIPELVRTLRDMGADIVIGSRYVPGGATERRWGLLRRLNSRMATFIARPLTRVHDPMAGFFAILRNTLRTARPLDPIGYKFLLELIVKCNCQQVIEIPIEFRDRQHGQSTLSLRDYANYVRHVARLLRFKCSHTGMGLVRNNHEQDDKHGSVSSASTRFYPPVKLEGSTTTTDASNGLVLKSHLASRLDEPPEHTQAPCRHWESQRLLHAISA